MLAAVSGILGTLSHQQREIISQQRSEPWQRRLIERLEWDFANARSYEAGPKQLTLIGYGGRDFATRAPTFRRAEIAYQIMDIGERSCLVRREVHADDRALDNSNMEVVSLDVTAIEIHPIDTPRRGNRPPTPGAIPRKLRFKLRSQSASATTMEATLSIY